MTKGLIKVGGALIDYNHKDAETYEKIVKFQKKLIKKKDSEPHNLSENDKHKGFY